MTTRELFRPDTVKILRILAKNRVELIDNVNELRKKYPDEYVAFHENEVVGHDEDENVLRTSLLRKYGSIEHIAIQFISRKELQLIL
jgi:hypothetical protein